MPNLSIIAQNLKSRVVRNRITNNTGKREIAKRDPDTLLPRFIRDLLGSIFGQVWRLRNWLTSGLLGNTFSFSSIMAWLEQAFWGIYYFNWQISDSEIDRLLAQQKTILAGYLGSTAGNLAGYLLCGVVPSATIMTFNEPLGAYLLKEVGEEALEELVSNLQLLLRATFNMGAQRIAYESFKNMRKNVREFVKDPNSPQSQFIRRVFGNNLDNALRSWGKEGNKPWSFAGAVEEWIESFKDPAIENFLENFVDDLIDSCIEAGYVIAGGLDSWVAQQKLAQATQFGVEEVVEIQPNREAPQEKIVLAAPRELMKTELVATMREHIMLDNRDVGMWVGEPVRENLRNDPISIQLKISLNAVAQAPFVTPEGKKSKRVTITVPNVDRAKIDWQAIKTAVGGTNGYLWGRFVAKGKFEGGYDMKIYGATADEAKDRLKACAVFSKSQILGITVTEETREARRLQYSALYKQPTRIYPISFTIINQQRVLNEESGRASLSGIYKQKDSRIPLNVPTKPNNFEEIVAELFRIPGPND